MGFSLPDLVDQAAGFGELIRRLARCAVGVLVPRILASLSESDPDPPPLRQLLLVQDDTLVTFPTEGRRDRPTNCALVANEAPCGAI